MVFILLIGIAFEQITVRWGLALPCFLGEVEQILLLDMLGIARPYPRLLERTMLTAL